MSGEFTLAEWPNYTPYGDDVPVVVLGAWPTIPRASALNFVSVNIQGMEGGARESTPGDTLGTDYFAPSQSDLNYLSTRGITVIRVPFMPERMFAAMAGDINETYAGQVEDILDRCAAATPTPIKALLDWHGYNEWKGADVAPLTHNLGATGSPFTVAIWSGQWTKIATRFKDHSALYGYDANEPQGVENHTTLLPTIMQAYYDAITALDTAHWIFVEGNNFSGAHEWTTQNPNYPISDPHNKIVYSAHMYMDPGYGGNTSTYPTWASCVAGGSTNQTGVDRIDVFSDWCALHGVRGNIGEIGLYEDGATAAANALNKAVSSGLSVFAWHYGPEFGPDAFALYPYDDTEQPQWEYIYPFTGYVEPPPLVADPAWTPLDLGTDLKLWLDAKEAATLSTTVDAAALGSWASRVNGITASAAGGNRPTYRATGRNGLPSVRFDGTDDRMAFSANTGFPLGASPATMVVVGYCSASGYRAALSYGATDNQRVILQHDDNENPAMVSVPGGITAQTTQTWLNNDRRIICWNIDATEVKFLVDGDPLQNRTTATINTGAGTGGIGAAFARDTNDPFSGDIQECMIVARVLTEQELVNLVAYLEAKW